MSRHPDFVPRGVIPAVLLPFHEDLSIDEPSFRSHLCDVALQLLFRKISESMDNHNSKIVDAGSVD